MTEVYESYEQDYMKTFNSIVSDLNQMDPNFNLIKQLLTECEDYLKHMDIESSSLAIKDQQQLKNKTRKYKQEWDQLRKQYIQKLDDEQTNKNRQNVLMESDNQAIKFIKTEEKLYEQTSKIIDAKRVVYDCELTVATIQKNLHDQTNQIGQTIAKTQDINQELSQSNTLVNIMKRRIQQNKMVCWLVIFIDGQDLGFRRYQSKIDYLMQENKQLQFKVQCLEETLSKYRKDSSQIVESKQAQQFDIYTLNSQLVKVTEERNIAQSKSLLNLQVCQQAEAFFHELLSEYEDKIQELRRIIHDKEYTLQEQERQQPQFDSDGILVKIREVIQLSEVSIKYHNQVEDLQQVIYKLNNQQGVLQQKIGDLQQENNIYKFEIGKFKHAFLNQVNYQRIRSYFNGFTSNTDTDLIVPQKQKSQVKRISQIFSQEQTGGQLHSFVHDKVAKLEQELERYRKLYDREQINLKLQQEQYEKLLKQLNHLEETNKRLIESNQNYQRKTLKLQATNQYLELFWQSFLQSQCSDKQITNIEQFVKHKIQYPIMQRRKNSAHEIKYNEKHELGEYKAYLYEMHRKMNTVKCLKLNSVRTQSEPPRWRSPILTKLGKPVPQMKVQEQDISIIKQQKDKNISVSFISQFDIF